MVCPYCSFKNAPTSMVCSQCGIVLKLGKTSRLVPAVRSGGGRAVVYARYSARQPPEAAPRGPANTDCRLRNPNPGTRGRRAERRGAGPIRPAAAGDSVSAARERSRRASTGSSRRVSLAAPMPSSPTMSESHWPGAAHKPRPAEMFLRAAQLGPQFRCAPAANLRPPCLRKTGQTPIPSAAHRP